MFHFIYHSADFIFFSAAFGFFKLLIDSLDLVVLAEAHPYHLLNYSPEEANEVHVVIGNDALY